MSQTSLQVYCLFSGMSMSLPFGNAENYRRASELAMSQVGMAGRTVSDSGEETFYLDAEHQLRALFDLQGEPEIKRLILAQRVEEDD